MLGVLITQRTHPKAMGLLEALNQSYQGRSVRIEKYRACDVLVLYGIGGEDRKTIADKHIKQGTLISFDAGYWDRALPLSERKYRVSINGPHPQKYIMQGPTPATSRYRFTVHTNYNPNGPILLVGHGPKSVQYNARNWTRAMAAELRKAFPGKKIIHRPKPRRIAEAGIDNDGTSRGKIEDELHKYSLVVCRHSNVAIDACRMGVPVVCEDGAAAAIYPQLSDYRNQPDIKTRKDFLTRLSWWQWSIEEINEGKFWPWMERKLADVL